MGCRRAVRGAAATALAMAAVAHVAAIALTLSTADIERALAVARASDAERTAFHARYRIASNDATLEQVEVITEFRRVVLAAEERGRMGDWMFLHSTGSVQKLVQPYRGLVTLVARLRFHPQNVLTSVPAYDLLLDDGRGGVVPPLDRRTTPTWSLPFKTRQGDQTALMGATLEIDLAASDVGQTSHKATLTLNGQNIAGVTIDFSRLD